RTAKHREILGEDENGATVDRPPAGNDAVARDLGLFHAELTRAVLDKHVELLKRVLVHEQNNAFARGELAAPVLGVDPILATAEPRILTALFQIFEDVFHASLRPDLDLAHAARSDMPLVTATVWLPGVHGPCLIMCCYRRSGIRPLRACRKLLG